MKKITFFLLILLMSYQVRSQNYTQEIDRVYQYLDKTPISSNILIDRVYSFAKLQDFNQNTQIDTSSYVHFKQAWNELYTASYVKNFSTVNQLKDQLFSKSYSDNEVPIGIINTEFHERDFGETQATAKVTYTNGYFYNKTTIIPFKKKQTTVIAPLTSHVIGSIISFKTDHLFKLYKYGKQIKTLQLITNGSTFTLISNYNLVSSNFSTSYTLSGLQSLRFVITYSDNTTKTTYGEVYIEVPTNYLAKSNVSSIRSITADDDLAFKGYDENVAIKGRNEYRIYYNDAGKILDKPLFIIDGYDPGDERKIDPQSPEYNDKKKSVIELMSYDHDNNDNTEKISLIDSLNHKGYDVIIVNHPKTYFKNGSVTTRQDFIDGGSDYIERNAFTLISLMRHIKSIQQGNEKAVVIGPSMGGLISRYALAYMEKKYAETSLEKWNHNTRLWVSFDSPHQGANIPIAVQHGIKQFASDFSNEGAQEYIDEQLDKPATKQMLVNHYTNNTSLPVGAPNFRNRFQSDLDQLGMPQNLRKVALINGSIMGALNGTSSAKFLDITARIPVLSADIVFADFYHGTNLKSGNDVLTYYGRAEIKLWCVLGSCATITFSQRHRYSKPTAKGSYDISPGGYFNAQALLADEASGSSFLSIWGWNFFRTFSTSANLIDPTHSFIPTKSALAYTGSNVLDEVIGNKDRVCSGETPFDSYFAPKDNEEHIKLTAENVAWLTKEIEGKEQSSTLFTPSNLTLDGDLTICFNKTNVYTINIPSCSATTTWAVSSGLQIISQSNNTINVAPISSTFTGAGYITATINGVTNELFKSVWIGTPPNNNTLAIKKIAGYEIYSQQWTKLKASFPVPSVLLIDSNIQAPFTFEWNVPNSYIKTNLDTSIIDVKPYYSGQINIGARAKNSCGCTNWSYQLFNVLPAPGSGGGPIFPVQQ